MSQEKKIENGLNIELSKEIARGIYSNFTIISHSHSEFVIDNISLLPGVSKAEVLSRIILSPENAKRLAMVLRDNVNKYEAQYGEIKNKSENENSLPLSFGQNNAKA